MARNVLSSVSEVLHYWANRVQPSGRSGNVYFAGDTLYSYGQHFPMARHLPNGTVAVTTRTYGPTTARHVSQTVRAIPRGRRVIHVFDPKGPACENLQTARREVLELLEKARKARLQDRRDAYVSHAQMLAEGANEYLAEALKLGPVSGEGALPIDLDNLPGVAVVLADARARRDAIEATQRALRKEQEAQWAADLAGSLVQWRNHEIVRRTGLSNLPPALRISQDGDAIETSHGASIPALCAPMLWRRVQQVRARSLPLDAPDFAVKLGHYSLTRINADGSIVVGCHAIAYSELEGIAQAIGLPTRALVPA